MGWTVKAQDSLRTVQLDDVVITGTKSEIPVEKSGMTIFKLTNEDIRESAGRSVADLLNTVPGIQMDGNFGPLGTNIGYFIRGASSKRTLILIDGVPFNDPSGIDQTYDLRMLDLNQVESIEVLKGGLSSLYGTGAAAGVINISLEKAKSEEISGGVGIQYGSFNTWSQNLNLSERVGDFSYSIHGGYTISDGFSAAVDQAGTGNFDDDGFEGFNFHGKFGYRFSDAFELTFTTSYDDFDSDFDGDAFLDAPNISLSHQLRFGITPRVKWQGGNLAGNFFVNENDRSFDFSGFILEYRGINRQMDLVVDQNLSDNLKVIGGLNYQYLAFSQPDVKEEAFNMIDPYATIIFEKSDFNLQVGGRLNNHSDYGSNFVYQVNPSYRLDLGSLRAKIYASYSTSFIAPSLTQLYGAFGPNPDLQPEESVSMEAGVTLSNEKQSIEVVYYQRNDENLIAYTTEYINSDDELKTNGVEINGSYQISEKVSLQGNYAYTNRITDQIAYRIPTHKYGAMINYRPLDRMTVKLNYSHTGERDLQFFDYSDFTFQQVNGESFDLFDLNVIYNWKSFTLSGTVNNLLDEEYQAIAGFTSVGRNYKLGLRLNF